MGRKKKKKKVDLGPFSEDEIESVRKKPKKRKRRYPKEEFYQDKVPDLPKDKYAQDKYDEDEEDVEASEGWDDDWSEWDDDFDDIFE